MAATKPRLLHGQLPGILETMPPRLIVYTILAHEERRCTMRERSNGPDSCEPELLGLVVTAIARIGCYSVLFVLKRCNHSGAFDIYHIIHHPLGNNTRKAKRCNHSDANIICFKEMQPAISEMQPSPVTPRDATTEMQLRFVISSRLMHTYMSPTHTYIHTPHTHGCTHIR